MTRIEFAMCTLVAVGLCMGVVGLLEARIRAEGYRAGYAAAADACNNALDGVLSDSLCACLERADRIQNDLREGAK